MKKRRIAIVAFMLATVLTLGIGYAAVSGALNIRGTGTFRGKNLAQNEILDAVRFTDAVGDEYANARLDPADDTIAVVDINFNDTTGVAQTYTSVSTFTIAYATENNTEMFPEVIIAAPTITQPQDPNWVVAVDWTEGQTLELGETTTITVTVTYKCDDPEAVANSETTGNFAVKLNFATAE